MQRFFRDISSRYDTVLHQLRSPLDRMQMLIRLARRLRPVLYLMAHFYRRFVIKRTKIVVVVGSFGKSTTARCALTALQGDEKGLSQRNAGSFVARSLLRIRPWQRHAVIEAGIRRPGQMALYARFLRPDITVVTAIGSEHNRALGTLETTRHEKAEMVRALGPDGLAFLNGDDPNVRWMATQTRANVVYFGFGRDNDVRADGYQTDWPNGSRFVLHIGGGIYDMRLRLIGRHMVYAALAATAVAISRGVAPQTVQARLAAFVPTAGRMQIVRLPNGAAILRKYALVANRNS